MKQHEAPHSKSSRPFSVLRRDFARYFPQDRHVSLLRKVRVFADTPGMQAILVYRYGSWVNREVSPRLLRMPLQLVHYVLDKLCIICWGISISDGARIGPGLYVGHFGGVIVGPVTMGTDCNINHQVTIGLRVDGLPGLPTIGDQVWIGVGSVIYGDIIVGSGATIAPYTVVSRSLPERVMVAGNPLRVVFKDYDNHQALYGRPRESGA